MKSIGILYICTGPYYLFWEDFFKSFEAKFLTDYEKNILYLLMQNTYMLKTIQMLRNIN